ncbi:MAG: hypothetical protein HYY02_12735 [Chloroflexi bacterium]|nr:hypothetical protein [Chloroflexota bacterium]
MGRLSPLPRYLPPHYQGLLVRSDQSTRSGTLGPARDGLALPGLVAETEIRRLAAEDSPC